jgi:hypothetical protein
VVTELGSAEVTDQELGQEIELLGEVITAAAGTRGHLSREEIDNALGLAAGDRHEPSKGCRGSARRRAVSPRS